MLMTRAGCRSSLAFVHLTIAVEGTEKSHDGLGRDPHTGKSPSDDPLDLDQFICCSAGPLTFRNTPREVDADDDDDDGAFGVIMAMLLLLLPLR